MNDKNRRYVILGILFLSWIIGYFDKNAINVAAIQIGKEFDLHQGQIGIVMSSFFLSYAAMTLFGGMLADRYGSRRVIAVIMVLWSLFTVFTGLAWSFASLVFTRFVFGAAEGGFPSASSVTIAELFPKEQRGRAKSFLVSAATVGMAFGTVIVAAIIVHAGGWRNAFFLFGGCGMILSAVFWTVCRRAMPAGAEEGKNTPARSSFKEVLRIPLVWKLAGMQFGIGFFLWGLNSWMPSYWVKVRHLDMVTMGALSSIPWIISFVLMNVSGWLLDRYLAGREKMLIAACMLVSAVFTYLMFNAESVAMAFTYLTVTTVMMSVSSPAIFVLPLKYVPKDFVGTSTGIANFGQQTAGILAPTIMGYMITFFHGSYEAVFWLVISMSLLTFLIALTVDTKRME